MFTGLIEGTAKVTRVTTSGGAASLQLESGEWASDLRAGDSVAIDGACLTASEVGGDIATFDVTAETLRVTTLGALRTGQLVNIERALRVGDRLGGHFVLGHVDVVGVIRALRPESGQTVLDVQTPREIASQLIPKGSIAVDGISLTIASVEPDGFAVAVIPETLRRTTLPRKAVGDRVNLELDVIGKYVARLLGRAGAPPGGALTEAFLKEHGF